MKALILNSGMGRRMGELTQDSPKCMTKISDTDTILSRQLKMIEAAGIGEVVITTGYCDDILMQYVSSLGLSLKISYVKNPIYDKSNYIYSIHLAKALLDDDIVLMHGDLVFEEAVFEDIIHSEVSAMTVSSTLPLPEKDFKAVIGDNVITKVGIEFFDNAYAAQPLYLIKKADWQIWVDEMSSFCEKGIIACYAENAFNQVSSKCIIRPLDVRNSLCSEIDTPEDLKRIREELNNINNRTVYMSFSTDMIHSGHIDIIKKAGKLGRLIIGILSDEAVVSYKRFPLLSCSDRMKMFENIQGVSQVVEQKTLSYKDNLETLKPDIVVHGDDWQKGIQKAIRDEVIAVLNSYGGKLIEYPYAGDSKFAALENRARQGLATPDIRRARLRKVLDMKGTVTALEAHSGLTGLIVEKTKVEENGGYRQFDAMWISSLCDSTAKGKPDIELVDMTSRFRTIDDICEVTTKPIIFDGDTGGLAEHFAYTVRSLERMGVSMIIVEDKKGLKKSSLFGNEVVQTQATIEEFSEKIRIGKKAQRTDDFMICARIESLILEKGMEDALERAFAFVDAGADAIMIHSRRKEPDEIIEFVKKFRVKDPHTYLVVVPTSFNSVTEEEFRSIGVNIVIYANQLTRTGFPAMENAAKTILANHRAKECDELCMPFKEIISLIPEEV